MATFASLSFQVADGGKSIPWQAFDAYRKSDFSHAAYASFRPSYPPKLYDTILSYHQGQYKTCLDLGCGHGLVSRAFSSHFDKVYGIDPSPGMIQQAKNLTSEQNIEFIESKAESLPFIASKSIDLVVSGEAAHWFDMPRLFAELNRIMRPGGTMAFWGYTDHVFPDFPHASALVEKYSHGLDKDLLGSYWPQPGRSILVNKLRAVQPPVDDWEDIQRVEYEPGTTGIGSGKGTKFMETTIPLRQTMEYLRTWSSYHGWKEAHPHRMRRSEGGEGDVGDELLDKIVGAEAGLSDPDQIVTVEWGSGLILARKL
ncbi:hypothetical protein FQN57_005974 [Myotisia sp. PD_48]|nr:hypothetical protein FQN57_005974 [Myotisia sp. PD_48]